MDTLFKCVHTNIVQYCYGRRQMGPSLFWSIEVILLRRLRITIMMFIEEYACPDLRESSPLFTDEMYQHGQMIGHVQPSPSPSERSVTSYASWASWTHATTELFSTFVEVYIRRKIAEERMNAVILFWVAPVEALWVVVWEQTLYSTSLSTGCLSPLLPSTPAGACSPPEGFPGAVCRGWTLSHCRPTCFCACVPEAPVLKAPGNVPGHGPTSALSATDPP